MPFTTVGSEFLVNTTTQGSQESQQITTLSGGRFVVTWTDYSQTGGDTDDAAVRAQVYEATGTPVGSEILVNTATSNDQDAAQITALSNGGFAVTWGDNSSGQDDLKARVFASDGTPVSSEIVVLSDTGGAQFDPEITGLAGGRFVIAWTDLGGIGGDGSGTTLMARVFEAGGTPVEAEFVVNSTTYSAQRDAKITALADGGFVVTWRDESFGLDVRAQVFDADGAPVGTEILVNAVTDGDQMEAQVTALAGGGFAIAWTERNYDSFQMVNLYDLRAQAFAADGTPVGGQDIQVNATFQIESYEPRIQGLANGGFVVAWGDASGQGDDPDGFTVQARVYGADGAPVGTAIMVNTSTAGTQSDPRIVALADGGFVVAFTDGVAGGGGDLIGAVRVQAFSEDGARVGTEILVDVATADAQKNAQLTALPDGGFVVTWMDESQAGGDTSGNAIRAQVFGIEGGAPTPTPSQPVATPDGGGPGDDLASLDANPNTYAAGAGNDWAFAGRGDDTIQGNAGNDTLYGDDGNDLVYGGKDNDQVYGGLGDDRLYGDLGDDTVDGGNGNDTLEGFDGDDRLDGGFGADVLQGSAGNDRAEGGEGADTVRGGQGNDVILGGAGNDWLSGDKGDDTLAGGAGADVFHSFSGAGVDRINDFNPAEGDRIQLDPGTTYAMAQVGGDTVLTLGGGGQVILTGVTATSLNGDWLFAA